MKHDKLNRTSDKINAGFLVFCGFVLLILIESLMGYYNFRNHEKMLSRSVYLVQLVRSSSDDLTYLFFNRTLVKGKVLKQEAKRLEQATYLIKQIRDGKAPWPKSYNAFLEQYLSTGDYEKSSIVKSLQARLIDDIVISETTKNHYLQALNYSDELYELEQQLSHQDFGDKDTSAAYFERCNQLKHKIVAEMGRGQSFAKKDLTSRWRSMLQQELVKLLIAISLLLGFIFHARRYQLGVRRELLSDFDAIEATIHEFKSEEGVRSVRQFYYDELQEINELLVETAAEKQRLIAENERLANIDSLTQLHNRRAIDKALAPQQRPSAAEEINLVLYIDLDHFKSINDTYGHDFGDGVLKGVAKLLRESIRKGDYAVRLGGEEFCVILRNFDLTVAKPFAERMRKKLAQLEFHHDDFDEPILVTASFGMTNQLPDEPFTETLERADRLLYQAKLRGRNRVACCWADLELNADGKHQREPCSINPKCSVARIATGLE